MPIIAHTLQQQIEVRPGRIIAEKCTEFLFILGSSLSGIDFAAHPVDVRGWQRGMIEQDFARHTIITVRMIWWHAAFITPKNMDIGPIQA